jgi:hypothetical protein
MSSSSISSASTKPIVFSPIKDGSKKELRLNLAGRPGGVGIIAPRITGSPAPWMSMCRYAT